MTQEQVNLVKENELQDKQRIANMISEGGLGAMYYYDFEFYEIDETKAMQDTTQQLHRLPH